jgi:nucleoid DNA-binding protein
MTKAQFASELASRTGMAKSQISSVLSAMTEVVAIEVGAGRPIAIPGLVKITSVRKAATHAHPGINPFTKEPIMVKAKPARNVVKVRALKALKEMV